MIKNTFLGLSMAASFLLCPMMSQGYADDIAIESIQSAEGASLNCTDYGEQLILVINGDTSRVEISAFPEEATINLTAKTEKYDVAVSAETKEEPQVILTVAINGYFANGEMVGGPGVSEKEAKEATDYYNLLKQALEEAQKKKQCSKFKL